MHLKLIEMPDERQREFLSATNRFVAYGGARGGGKSWAVRQKAKLLAANFAGIRIMIMRSSYTELQENHILPLMTELYGAARYKSSEKVFIFPNGSRIKFGYCDTDSDVSQYQGQEYDVIFIDEATQFTEWQFNNILACNRGANSFPKRVYLTCNPGGTGHAWVKRLFIDRDFYKGESPDDYLFIPARVYDNAALIKKDPGYLKTLESLPDDMRRAWLDGDWDVFAGQYFSEFRRDIHVIAPFTIPAHWRRYAALDYGLDMLACVWAAFDGDGNCFVYREIYKPELIVSQAAAEILSHKGDNIYACFAAPDLWGRTADRGKSRAELFGDCGLQLTQISARGRVDGWLNLKEWLKASPSPRLKIFSNCRNLIRTLPMLTHDPHNPDDCATQPHEITHAPDALRYLLCARPAPAAASVGRTSLNWGFERPKKSYAGKGDRVKVI